MIRSNSTEPKMVEPQEAVKREVKDYETLYKSFDPVLATQNAANKRAEFFFNMFDKPATWIKGKQLSASDELYHAKSRK